MGFGQTGDEHPRWSFLLGEGKPVIIKAGKVCADQEAGLLDIQETSSAHNVANLSGALYGRSKGRSMDGLSTPAMTQIVGFRVPKASSSGGIRSHGRVAATVPL